IGHLHWYLEGFLQRDVAFGNVLRLKIPQLFINRSLAFLGKYLDTCSGFINDADLAVEWRKVRVPGKDRSGTLPFLSLRILEEWCENQPVVQTAIDDLASFFWVLL
ncbi:hypothetical protein FISHEDRAFT_25157, partial [Fistulina hepatica ATCC 64428]